MSAKRRRHVRTKPPGKAVSHRRPLRGGPKQAGHDALAMNWKRIAPGYYINAHGTGDYVVRKIETEGYWQVFHQGQRIRRERSLTAAKRYALQASQTAD